MMMQKYNISLIQTNNESIKLNKGGTSHFRDAPFILPFKLLEQRAPSSLLGWSSRDKSHPLRTRGTGSCFT